MAAQALAADPADPNYTEKVVLDLAALSLEPVENGSTELEHASIAMTNAIIRSIAALGAAISAAEKYEGAIQAGDTTAATERLAEFKEFSRVLNQLTQEAQTTVTSFQSAFNSTFHDFQFNAETVQNVIDFLNANGVDPSVVNEFAALDLQSLVLLDPTDLTFLLSGLRLDWEFR